MIDRLLSRLPAKLTILYSSLFLCIFVPIVLTYYLVTQENIREDIRQGFTSSEMVFRQLMRMRSDQMRESVRLLTQDFGFRQAVATGDIGTIDSAIDNLGSRLNVKWGFVADTDGGVLSNSHADFDRLPILDALLFNAEADGSATDIRFINGEVQQLIAMPIHAPELLGWAVFGVELNTTDLQSLSDTSSVPFDAIILHVTEEDQWAQTTITRDARLRESVLQTVLQEIQPDTTKTLELKGEEGEQLLLVSALPVAEGSPAVVLVLRARLKEAFAGYRELFFALAVIGVFGVVLLTIGSLVLSFNVTRPLTELAAAAHRFGQGKHYKLELRNRSDEIGRLASSFNAMATEIQDRTHQLELLNANLESRVADRSRELSETNVKLRREIEQRRQFELKLLEEKTKAEKANRAKDDFLATMSHELRTPMNGIMGIVHYLKSAEMSEDFRKNIGILEDSANLLLTILNDVLDFAKIEAGAIDIEAEMFSLHDMISGMEDLWRASADDKGLDFTVELAFDSSERFIGDKTRIRQIINNYLSNAIKFTQSGKVSLSAKCIRTDDDTSVMRFCVKDTGPGIRPDEVPLLFEKFSQLEAGKARKFSGTGLGLAICRRLATAMNGKVGVESAPGEGSEFWCELPLKKAGEAQKDAEKDSGEIVPRGAVQPGAGKDLRILLVEDNDINVRVISLFIEQLGYKVSDVARDGCEAVDKVTAGSNEWDVVFMDLRMPNMDGLEATRRIRDAGYDAETLPIIALTADTMEADRKACKEAGMTDFIGKPVTPAALTAAFDKVMYARTIHMSSVA